jgi:hypothetical protein
VNSESGPRANPEQDVSPSWYAAAMRTAYEAHAEDDDSVRPGTLLRTAMNNAGAGWPATSSPPS